VATVEGRLTEPLWRESAAVSLSPVGDAAALAANIRKLLRDHEARARLAESAKRLYQERFSLDHTVAQLLR
jgi:glycosyltransferase involved in cell wall biosynthesis